MSYSTIISRQQRWQLALFLIAVALVFTMTHQRNHRFDDVKEISVTEARQLIDSGALVVDVRSEEKFQARHIPGALSLPLSLLQSGIPASIAQEKDKPIVVYCGDGVTTGPEGTQILNQAGYSKAVNVKAGLEGWVDAGLPVQH